MKPVQLVSKTTTSSNVQQVQVSLNINYDGQTVGMVNLSGGWKAKAEAIATKWSSVEPQVTVSKNTFGQAKGYQIHATNGMLVGFVNFFTNVPEDTVQALLAGSTYEVSKGVDLDTI